MIRVKNVKVSVLNDDLFLGVQKKVKTSNFKIIKILHKSIDARNKNDIFYVYDVVIDSNEKIHLNDNIFLYEEKENKLTIKGSEKLLGSIDIIGAGPSGLFCAYILSINGYNVRLFERGKCVEERKIDVQNFWDNNKLNLNSNVLFGEGGAGTFSDGKLMTNIKDKDGLISLVLKIFYENGAKEDILYSNHPHLGTDELEKIVRNIRNKIIENGGQIYFSSMLTDIIIENNKVKGFIINNDKTYETDNLVLAIGHSAKETFKLLHEKNVAMENKPFAVGIRIMHDEKLIDENQYGKFSKYLPHAEYKLTFKSSSNKGVYSFCMCPGGYVVNSSSEEKHLSINGMSYSSRDSGVSNSAIIVTVSDKDYGSNVLDGLKFQELLEEKAYALGNGCIPIQTFGDYKNNTINEKSFNNLKIKGKTKYANINEIFPKEINDSLKEAIDNFSHKIKGFNDENTLIAAVESRTSSPVKFIRNEDMSSSVKGLYPIGEGSGYAGGITTSAIEGIKMAKVFMKKYIPNQKYK